MPSETIHGTGLPIDVRILWGRDCDYVQVGTQHEAGVQALLVVVNEWLKAAGHQVIDIDLLVADLAKAGNHVTEHGWYATIDNRRNVNQLIEVLRRARDHAFGKDE